MFILTRTLTIIFLIYTIVHNYLLTIYDAMDNIKEHVTHMGIIQLRKEVLAPLINRRLYLPLFYGTTHGRYSMNPSSFPRLLPTHPTPESYLRGPLSHALTPSIKYKQLPHFTRSLQDGYASWFPPPPHPDPPPPLTHGPPHEFGLCSQRSSDADRSIASH